MYSKKSDIKFDTIRDELEYREELVLSPHACLSHKSKGRLYPTTPCNIRTTFQRDRDRIVYSKAFRRLKHKTQVFLAPTGDHYRTRLTHTLEVAEIARTITRALRLNEDLSEAVAMGHDLGHTPFGHAGETILNEIVPGGFTHWGQSLRVVDVLENGGKGLNLSYEVRDGIVKHSKGFGNIIPKGVGETAKTHEGRIVRIADVIAYLNHDLDDAIRSGVIRVEDIPSEFVEKLGETNSKRLSSMIKDILLSTSMDEEKMEISISPSMLDVMTKLRAFLYDNVYRSAQVHQEFEKARKILRDIYYYFVENRKVFINENSMLFEEKPNNEDKTPYERQVCDFIAGMTDRYALDLYYRLFIPSSIV